ncbi:hypothetical protein [Bdellovibrio sp. NC01]|uniref:hypothetical protein n=1 Tax=Bdellovibrio sp. NC01 TaxID=2220073 RepID=UPI0011589B9C|nr:hypothetical protein [Bdellovibrio sp. NC01]QDK37762.1 hypothetical protein DOE51_09290 [Bdellovibrio sp. NC01]
MKILKLLALGLLVFASGQAFATPVICGIDTESCPEQAPYACYEITWNNSDIFCSEKNISKPATTTPKVTDPRIEARFVCQINRDKCPNEAEPYFCTGYGWVGPGMDHCSATGSDGHFNR